MVKIPRAEQSIAANPPPMPNLVGEGWTAPGRAMQQLGQGISSFGAGLQALGRDNDEDELHRAKIDLVNAANAQDLDDMERSATYDGDGDGYTTERVGAWQTREQELLGRYSNASPRVRRFVELGVASRRGTIQERAYRQESVARTKAEFGVAQTTVTSTFDVLNAASKEMDPETYDNELVARAQAMNGMIDGYRHIGEEGRRALRNEVARQFGASYNAYYGKGRGAMEPGIADRVLQLNQRLQQMQVPAPAEVGPQGAVDPAEFEQRVTPEQFFAGQNVDVSKLPLGMRLSNNPTNIKFTGSSWQRQNFVGVVGPSEAKDQGDPQILFANPAAGYASAAKLALLKQDQGMGTVRQLIAGKQGWTPGFDAAAENVARLMGVKADDAVNLRDAGTMQKFLRALTEQEHGQSGKLYSDDLIRKGVSFALGGGTQRGPAGPRPAKPAEFLQSKLAKGYESRVSDVQNLHPVMQDRLAAFLAAAEDAGHDIRVISGHRSEERQAALWQAALKKYGSAEEARKWVAPPGGSTHGSGEATDLQFGDRGAGLGGRRTAAVQWAHDNAKKFGLHFPLNHEDWHIEPVEARAGVKRYGGTYAKAEPLYKGGGMSPSLPPTASRPVAERGITAGMTPGTRVASRTDVATDAAPAAPETSPGQGGGGPVVPSGADGAAAAAGREPQTQVAQAGGQPPAQPQVRYRPSVFSEIIESNNKALPAWAERDRAIMDGKVKSVEERGNKGELPPLEEVQKMTEQLQRYGTPEQRARFMYALEGARVIKEYLQKSPAEVADAISAINALGQARGFTPELSAHKAALEKLATRQQEGINKSQLEWADSVGNIKLSPITPEMMRADGDGGIEAMRVRAAQAKTTASKYEREPVFLTPKEKDAFAAQFKKGGAAMIDLITKINEGFGADAPRVFAEFSKDAPEAAMTGWLIANKGSTIAIADMAQALELRQDPKFKSVAPSYEEARRVLQTSSVARGLFTAPKVEERAIQAANLLYEVRARRNGEDGKIVNEELWREGMMEVLGETEGPDGAKYGGVVRNGSWGMGLPIVIPPNMRQDKFWSVIEALRPEDLMRPGTAAPAAAPTQLPALDTNSGTMPDMMPPAPSPEAAEVDPVAARIRDQVAKGQPAIQAVGGAPVDDRGRPVPMSMIRNATLVSIGDGRYWLALSDPTNRNAKFVGSLTAPDGRFVLDLRQMEGVLKARVPDAYRN